MKFPYEVITEETEMIPGYDYVLMAYYDRWHSLHLFWMDYTKEGKKYEGWYFNDYDQKDSTKRLLKKVDLTEEWHGYYLLRLEPPDIF